MSHLQSKRQVISNTITGLYLGYPSCCIVDFHVRQLDGRISRDDHRAYLFNGTGYVCCPKCNNKGVMQLHCEIANARYALTPFPVEPTELEDDIAHYIVPRDRIRAVTELAIKECEKFIRFE